MTNFILRTVCMFLNVARLVLVILVLSFLVFACSSTQVARKPPAFKITEITMAKGIDEKWSKEILLGPTRSFTTEDTEVVSHVKFANLTGKHNFRWEWYTPNGDSYYATSNHPVKTSKGKYIESGTTWHKISIKGEKAQKCPGKWKVDIWMDDSLIASENFEIRPYKPTVGLPPMLSVEEILFSGNVLDAGETAELKVTLKNIGHGNASDVYLELSSNTEGLSFERKRSFPLIVKKGGCQTASIPIRGDLELQTGKAYIDVQIVEPNFGVKIKGKRLNFHTRKVCSPELILAKFAAIESESSAQNQKIDINEIIDLKMAVQNIGMGTAENVKIEVTNNQTGVIFLGIGQGENLARKSPQIKKIDVGKHKIINYRYFVNSEFRDEALEFHIKGRERFDRYGFSERKVVAINTQLRPEGYIRKVSIDKDIVAGGVIIEDIPDFQVDVDVNIPGTKMHNPDAVAVVIGNRNYQHRDVPSVEYARRDAEIVRRYLIKTLGFREGNIICKSDTTKAEFEALFGIAGNHRGKLHDYIKPNRSDVFIYYSGHGAPDINNNKGYFVPANCDPSKIVFNGYPLDVFYDNLSKLSAKSITVVLDACFSGGTDSGKSLIANASPTLIKVNNRTFATGKARIFASSQGDQISSWYNEKQHGLFTYFFLKAIGGAADKNENNEVTFQEIHDYVSDMAEGVPYWARRLHGGRVQTPVLQGQSNTEVFVRY